MISGIRSWVCSAVQPLIAVARRLGRALVVDLAQRRRRSSAARVSRNGCCQATPGLAEQLVGRVEGDLGVLVVRDRAGQRLDVRRERVAARRRGTRCPTAASTASISSRVGADGAVDGHAERDGGGVRRERQVARPRRPAARRARRRARARRDAGGDRGGIGGGPLDVGRDQPDPAGRQPLGGEPSSEHPANRPGAATTSPLSVPARSRSRRAQHAGWDAPRCQPGSWGRQLGLGAQDAELVALRVREDHPAAAGAVLPPVVGDLRGAVGEQPLDLLVPRALARAAGRSGSGACRAWGRAPR